MTPGLPVTVVQDPVTVTIQGLDDTTNTIKLETPQPLKGEIKAALAITEPIKTEIKAALAITEPIKTEVKAALAITEPIRTESKLSATSELDIKPVVVDQCLNLRLGPLPPTCVRQPYQLHLGLTLFGVEIFGVNLNGESQVMVSELPAKPQLAWGDEHAAAGRTAAAPPVAKPEFREAPLRIRLGP